MQAKTSSTPLPEFTAHAFNPTILREYDIRGIVGKTLHEADALAIGLGFGTMLRAQGGKTIVTGFDGRHSSPAFHAALVRGLTATGCDVTTIGIGPTPMTYFAARHLNTDAAVMVTGSHNPGDFNGFKFMARNKPFYGDAIQQLGRLCAAGAYALETPGNVTTANVADAYVTRLLADFAPAKPLNVVWDAGNGAAGDVLKKLVAKLPGKHTVLYADIDGSFPNHHPDPTVDANLRDLQAKMRETGADLGIAFDGDGDRIGAVDERGQVIRCDMLLALYAAEVIAANPGATIIGDVKCSGALFTEIARLGGTPLMWKTGHSLVKAKMAETNAPLAGELSGHIFFADKYYGFDDALYCAVRLLNIVGGADKTLSGLLAHLPTRLGTPEMRIDVDDTAKFAVVDRLKARLETAFAGQGYTISAIDGIRLDGPEGWMLLRASNTEARLVARIEAQNSETLALLESRLKSALEAEHLGLPGPNNH